METKQESRTLAERHLHVVFSQGATEGASKTVHRVVSESIKLGGVQVFTSTAVVDPAGIASCPHPVPTRRKPVFLADSNLLVRTEVFLSDGLNLPLDLGVIETERVNLASGEPRGIQQ